MLPPMPCVVVLFEAFLLNNHLLPENIPEPKDVPSMFWPSDWSKLAFGLGLI